MKHFTHVIAVHGPILRWIEPWYAFYGILGALVQSQTAFVGIDDGAGHCEEGDAMIGFIVGAGLPIPVSPGGLW